MSEKVTLYTYSLKELFSSEEGLLTIPDYQRTYCWLPKNVYKLLDDIWNVKKGYHLGCIILQKKEGKLNIIDGQQRLITLTLILSELGCENLPLLSQKIESEEAVEYIAYNKYLIGNYVKRLHLNSEQCKGKTQKILENLKFSVLMLDDSSLDLAYTFFSSQNSKGVKLTSYDLLKSHHLHFITDDKQAVHMAKLWDAVLSENSNTASEEKVEITLGIYLFRMRKWLYGGYWNEGSAFKVKEEFESALIVPEIPPFGEQFNFNEPIQGGTHFFAYANHFIMRCRDYHRTSAYQSLKKIDGESHKWFRQVIESILFAYYLKFGNSYLPEALFGISKIVSQRRLENKRIEEMDIVKDPRNSMLMRMLDQATSPTFFLAAMRNEYNKMPALEETAPIMKRFFKQMKACLDRVASEMNSTTIKGDYNGK